jgi:hypothetical protein
VTEQEQEWVHQELDRTWPHLRAAIAKMKQLYGREYVEQKLMNDEAQLWPGIDSAILTQIEVHPDGTKELFYWLAGGNRQEINTLQVKIEAWARDCGCTQARSINRIGSMKVPFNGFSVSAVVMKKEL